MAKKKSKKRTTKKATKRTTKRTTKRATRRPKKKKLTSGLAIAGLLLNVLILPGLGSVIAGETRTGIWQIALSVVGVVLTLVVIGIPILIGAWIWGLVTGIQLVQRTT